MLRARLLPRVRLGLGGPMATQRSLGRNLWPPYLRMVRTWGRRTAQHTLVEAVECPQHRTAVTILGTAGEGHQPVAGELAAQQLQLEVVLRAVLPLASGLLLVLELPVTVGL